MKRWIVFLSFLAIAVIVSRRPDALTNPQFWAEDGATWYAQAYNFGPLKPFFIAPTGHLQTVPRLVAALAQLFPLKNGPLLFNLIALLSQFLPIGLILAGRANWLFPNFWGKILFIFAYLLLPNTAETYLNLTNSQWYLAIGAMIILFNESLRTSFWRWFDGAILFLSGLSGPFSLFFLLPAFLHWRQHRNRQFLPKLLTVVITALVQLTTLLLTGGGTRTNWPSGVSFQNFSQIFSRQIVWGAIAGPVGYNWLTNFISSIDLLSSATIIVGLFLIVSVLIKAPVKIRLVALFGGLNLLAGLLSPTLIPQDKTAWAILVEAHGIRYWLIPMITFLIVLLWGTKKTNSRPVRTLAFFFLAIMGFFWIKNYRFRPLYQYPPYIDFHYQEEIKNFEQLKPGEKQEILLNPSGWKMILIKH